MPPYFRLFPDLIRSLNLHEKQFKQFSITVFCYHYFKLHVLKVQNNDKIENISSNKQSRT